MSRLDNFVFFVGIGDDDDVDHDDVDRDNADPGDVDHDDYDDCHG